MEVVVIESQTFTKLTGKLEWAVAKIEQVMTENLKLKEDRWMTAEEAAEYTGFKTQWVLRRKVELQAFVEGTSVKFKKSSLDAYMDSRRLISKQRNFLSKRYQNG